MTDNRKLEAAIAAGLAADNKIIESLWFKDSEVDQDLLQVSADGATAFTAYRNRFHALEADNERTNRDRSALCVDFALLTEENARLRETLRQIHNNAPKQEPIQPHPQNYPQAHSFWVAGQLAAAVLADSEGE